MREYEVEIRETLSLTVKVQAQNPQMAKELVQEQYRNEEFVLGADDFRGVEFKVNTPIRNRNATR